MANHPPDITIEKLSADLYIDKWTGEIKEFQHHDSRAADKGSVSQNLRKLRDLINANLENPEAALWVTLTYRENMTDPARLYEDYCRFWQRLKYYLRKQGHPTAEYIIAAEPQGRGAWHLHCLFLFSDKAPFISNADMAKIWDHGFTKIQSLKGVGNPGLYLTAYLGDMELSEAVNAGQFKAAQLAETKDKSKAVIEGDRLNLLTYEKTISITDEWGNTRNIINYRTYTKGADTSCTESKDTASKKAGSTEGTPI